MVVHKLNRCSCPILVQNPLVRARRLGARENLQRDPSFPSPCCPSRSNGAHFSSVATNDNTCFQSEGARRISMFSARRTARTGCVSASTVPFAHGEYATVNSWLSVRACKVLHDLILLMPSLVADLDLRVCEGSHPKSQCIGGCFFRRCVAWHEPTVRRNAVF